MPEFVNMPDLPDDLFDSKDWRAADYGGRVEWLLTMYRSAREQEEAAWRTIDHLSDIIDRQKTV
jgi:hypothetical protein